MQNHHINWTTIGNLQSWLKNSSQCSMGLAHFPLWGFVASAVWKVSLLHHCFWGGTAPEAWASGSHHAWAAQNGAAIGAIFTSLMWGSGPVWYLRKILKDFLGEKSMSILDPMGDFGYLKCLPWRWKLTSFDSTLEQKWVFFIPHWTQIACFLGKPSNSFAGNHHGAAPLWRFFVALRGTLHDLIGVTYWTSCDENWPSETSHSMAHGHAIVMEYQPALNGLIGNLSLW